MICIFLTILFLGENTLNIDSDLVDHTIEAPQEKLGFISVQDSILRHVVLFGFTTDATEGDIDKIEKAFAGLASKIDGIVDFEWGINNSPEGLDQGHTHCFIVSFDSAAARDAYLPHPDHKAFVDLAGPFIENVTVIDYWTGAN